MAITPRGAHLRALLRLMLLLAILLRGIGFSTPAPSAAQGNPDATARVSLYVQAGPGMEYRTLNVLPARTELYFEARNPDTSWLLSYSADGAYRGWIASAYVDFRLGFNAQLLPVKTGQGTHVPMLDRVRRAMLRLPTYSPTQIVSSQVRTIFARGQQLGNRSNAFLKIGDSVTVEEYFLEAFASGNFYLGPYLELQATVDAFNATESFYRAAETARSGFTAASVLDPDWANPFVCAQGETPLDCELRRHQPSFAFIYFSGNDMFNWSVAEFDAHLDTIVTQLIDAGVIPILSTFAIAPDDRTTALFTFTAAVPYEEVIRIVAMRHGVPLIEFQRAAMALPDWGTLPDGYHLTLREDRHIAFNGDETRYGVTLRDFMSLRLLHTLYTTLTGS